MKSQPFLTLFYIDSPRIFYGPCVYKAPSPPIVCHITSVHIFSQAADISVLGAGGDHGCGPDAWQCRPEPAQPDDGVTSPVCPVFSVSMLGSSDGHLVVTTSSCDDDPPVVRPWSVIIVMDASKSPSVWLPGLMCEAT